MSTNELKIDIEKLHKSDMDEYAIKQLRAVSEKESTKLQKKDLMKYRQMQKEEISYYRHQLACLDYLIINLKNQKERK